MKSGAAPVLLTVSGTIDPDARDAVAHGRRPRADYFELADACAAEILDFNGAVEILGRIGPVVRRLAGPDVALAIACLRRRRVHRVILTDSERVGMIFATMRQLTRRRGSARHVMIGHRLSAPKKLLVHRLLRLRRRIDRVVVYATRQREVSIDDLGYRPEQVVLTSFMVDTRFWAKDAMLHPPQEQIPPVICAVGQELRDYETLVEAGRGLDVELVIAAASPWSKRDDSSAGIDIPENVKVVRLDQFHLRELYAAAKFVVVPLVETDFQAGITTILEAMSMGLAVVCTRTTGQTDTLIDGETGLYVPPSSPEDLRHAIRRLLDSPSEAARIGAAAQTWVRQRADIEIYARRLATIVGSLGPT